MVGWHDILILLLEFSSETKYDPKLEEFVWFGAEFEDTHQPQAKDRCRKCQHHMKQDLEEEVPTRPDKPNKKTRKWTQKDEIFAKYFFLTDIHKLFDY